MEQNPNELLKQGKAAFRAGNLKMAEELLAEAAAMPHQAAAAYSLLSIIARSRGDLVAAEQLAGLGAAADPLAPAPHDALVEAQLAAQGAEALLESYRLAAEARPYDFGAVYGAGALLFAAKQWEESVEWLRRAMALAPESSAVGLKTAQAQYNGGSYIKALSLITELRRRGEDEAALHELAGRALLQAKRPEKAVVAFRRALERKPDELMYHANLSAALFRAGHLKDARQVTRNFLTRFPAYTITAKSPEARVLVISGIGGTKGCVTNTVANRKSIYITGNSLALVGGDRNTYHFASIHHPDLAAAARELGPVDVIFNNLAAAEASIKSGHGLRVRNVAHELGLPVINAPEAVEQTTRANNARIITENTDILYPATVLFHLVADGPEKTKARILEAVRFPMLIRRSSTNMDMDVRFVADETALAEALEYYHGMDVEDIYAIEFVTEEFRPGIYRKIRCAIIDHVVYPVRVDFSTHWNVRRKAKDSAVSLANPDLMDSEHAFLRDPVAYLGTKNMARLEALGRLHNLDFLGVDFNIIGDGNMVIFEANPAMNCIEKRRIEEFPYFAGYWEPVMTAFEDMIVKKARKR